VSVNVVPFHPLPFLFSLSFLLLTLMIAYVGGLDLGVGTSVVTNSTTTQYHMRRPLDIDAGQLQGQESMGDYK
jgi:hypothetical protein